MGTQNMEKSHVNARNMGKLSIFPNAWIRTKGFAFEGNPMNINNVIKGFRYLSSLQNHKRIHTRNKNHECKQHVKAFRRQTVLQVHEGIHIGEKPFMYKLCGKAFTFYSRL
jgi:KRAB domain-containing zinc finger protein